MSGPVTPPDELPVAAGAATVEDRPSEIEVSAARASTVGALPVRRALPQRTRRTVGAWCFADHMGPVRVDEAQGVDIGPHPHIGLQTVTWLLAGELLHRDSLGSEQVIRPGQLNLMTAGRGVAHAEEGTPGFRGELHGVQLWVAQPEHTRHGAAAFEHHATLPEVDLDGAVATVLVGELAGGSSPARCDTDHLGADLALRPGRTVVPVRAAHEHAVIALDGALLVDGTALSPGALGYRGVGRDELVLEATAPVRVLLLGGVPFAERIVMWWNFVGRDNDELAAADAAWRDHDARFGTVASPLPRVPAPTPPWLRATS